MYLQLRLMLVCIGFFSLQIIQADNFKQIAGGRYTAMGCSGISLSDEWSVHNNQAGMAFITAPSVNLYYNSPLGISQLAYKSAGISYPYGNGALGLDISHFGYSAYGEFEIGVAYAKLLTDNFSSGIKLDLLSIYLGEDYGSTYLLTFEFGSIYQINEYFNFGFHIFNPLSVRFSNYEHERIPAIFRTGISYQISKNLLAVFDIEKNMIYKPAMKAGLEYQLSNSAFVRMGYYTSPAVSTSKTLTHSGNYTFGFGVNYKKLRLDISSGIHQTLGWSPHFSMTYIP